MALRGGIDLGGTKIEAIVVDDSNAVLGASRRATPTDGGPPGVVKELAAAVTEAATAAGTEPGALAGVGVGSPGEIDAKAGTLASAGNLNGWEGVSRSRTSSAATLGIRVAVGNDVRVAVEAERLLGAGRNYRSFLGVWWGTGVGGALVLDGKLWLGRGFADELGHVVVKIDGAPLPLRPPRLSRGLRRTRRDGAPRAQGESRPGEDEALRDHARSRTASRLTSGVWATALVRGDELAKELLEEAVEALGAGIGSVDNLLDLDASSSAAVSARDSGSRTSSASRRRRSRISSSRPAAGVPARQSSATGRRDRRRAARRRPQLTPRAPCPVSRSARRRRHRAQDSARRLRARPLRLAAGRALLRRRRAASELRLRRLPTRDRSARRRRPRPLRRVARRIACARARRRGRSRRRLHVDRARARRLPVGRRRSRPRPPG